MRDRETPSDLGYRWPAEWKPHTSTWLAWPHNAATWPGKFEKIPPHFAKIVRTLAQFEPVNVLAGGEAVMADAQSRVSDLPNVTLHNIETNDAWTRDYGPTFLVGPPDLHSAVVDWQYNAWGAKYPPWDKDNGVTRQISAAFGYRRFSPAVVLEGGAIDGNGQGTILTTESCLLNPNRNPSMTRQRIERYLKEYCCAIKVLWLSGGEIAGDDTDGHVDQLARFVNPSTVLAALENRTSDINHEPLQRNFEQLQSMTDQDGKPLDVIPLPMPRPLYYDGRRLPASYANFYIANGVVIVPQFDDPADAVAIETLSNVFPDRKIVGLDAIDIIWGLGAVHCLTQQQPAS